MLIKGIPSDQIVTKIAKLNKDYELEFINTESNNDVYVLKIYLRRNEEQYKIRLVLISSVLAYPALDLSWVFEEKDYELASRVFHRVCDEADDVKTQYDRSMMPVSTIGAKIREAVKPIAAKYQEKTNILAIDEAGITAGVSDWRFSLYAGRYPHTSKQEKNKYYKYEGNKEEYIPQYKISPPRKNNGPK